MGARINVFYTLQDLTAISHGISLQVANSL
uniref:Uncharacterized protein n=1 Tax=Arundo donax TaxID=35708 RepID=A0A0A9HFQ4_ARUDO